MAYIENPKTKGSGILCAIPQAGTCPYNCPDCFFQSGRSYLEPLEKNLPNMPTPEQAKGRVVRFNDGNDSAVNIDTVISASGQYADVFFNTSQLSAVPRLPGPVVLTANPGTRSAFQKLPEHRDIPNLMFIRLVVSMWNQRAACEAAALITSRRIPVVLTFLACYTTEVPPMYKKFYTYKKRILNSSWCINQLGWDTIVSNYKDSPLVYTCGRDADTHACKYCGVCLREYYATKERLWKRG